MERMSQGKDDDNVIQVTFGGMTWNGFFTFPFPPNFHAVNFPSHSHFQV